MNNNVTTIFSFEAENVKKLKVVELQCDGKNLVTIGGNNRQGKTSILNAIQWILLGGTYAGSGIKRDGAETEPKGKIVLSNGLIVERKGENSRLKITAPNGFTSSKESDLRQIINMLSLDLSKFINSTDKEKAGYLLEIIGHRDKLNEFDRKEKQLEDERVITGRDLRQKQAHADSLQSYPGIREEPIVLSDIMGQINQINEANRNNEKLRDEHQRDVDELARKEQTLSELEAELERKRQDVAKLRKDVKAGEEYISKLPPDESTIELDEQLKNSEKINEQIRANQDKKKALTEAENQRQHYEKLTGQIDEVRKERLNLLNNAQLPLTGLSIENGELIYNSHKWDCMSGAEQLIVATSIVRHMNPTCGFVLIDGIEQMDMATLEQFGQWLHEQGMQAITTRVSKGEECSVIIEDGMVLN